MILYFNLNHIKIKKYYFCLTKGGTHEVKQ
jgi:hypothetical protein